MYEIVSNHFNEIYRRQWIITHLNVELLLSLWGKAGAKPTYWSTSAHLQE